MERIISTPALRLWMARRGLSVRELAALVECSPSGIGHLRSGRSVQVRPERARLIEEALSVPHGWLFTVDQRVTTDNSVSGEQDGENG